MAKFQWMRSKEEEGKEPEFTLPDELTRQIKAGADAAAALPKLTEMLEGLTRIQQEDAAARKKEKDDAAAAAVASRASKSQEDLDAELNELILTDPRAAISKATSPLAQELILLRFAQTKNDVLSDEKAFEYYHGDIKKEIDSLIESQSLQFKGDPKFARENIKNCYDTVVGRHHKEILEGKIKTRFAGGEGARGTASGAAGDSSSEGTKTPVVTDDIRRAAKLLGFKPEEYAKMLDDEGVGYA